MSRSHPRRRTRDLVTESYRDEAGRPEVRVFDLESELGFTLRGVVEVVWRLADGTRSVDEIARLVARELDEPNALPLVKQALDELRAAGLLAGVRASVRTFARRTFLKGATAAAALLAVISIPGEARAGTGFGGGGNSGSGF